MYEVEIELKFDAAHRLLNYIGPCQNNHGHNFHVLCKFSSKYLNELGFVQDFRSLKVPIKKWIDDNWDHGTLLNPEDITLIQFLKDEENKIYYDFEGNPTAENISKKLFHIIHMLGMGEHLISVSIKETETSMATYFEHDYIKDHEESLYYHPDTVDEDY